MPLARPRGTPGKRPDLRRPGFIIPLDRAKWYRKLEARAARYRRSITKHEVKFRDLDAATKQEIMAFQEKEIMGQVAGFGFGTVGAAAPIIAAHASANQQASTMMVGLVPLSFLPLVAATSNEFLRRVRIRIQQSNNPKIKRYLAQSKYFFLDRNGNIIFTDSNPFLALRKRLRTDEKNQRSSWGWRLIDRLNDIYYRGLWPYLFSQVQLPIPRYRALRKAADIQKGMTVVEIASGSIPYHSMFRKAVGKEGKLIVGDINPRVTKDARRIMRGIQLAEKLVRGKKTNEKAEPHYLAFSTENLPFADNSVDRVVGSYVYDVNVPELARVLKKGGKLVLVVGGGCRFNGLDKLEKRGVMKHEHQNGITTLTKLTN